MSSTKKSISFSDNYVPTLVWVIETTHDFLSDGYFGDKIIPKGLVEYIMKSINMEKNVTETIMFVKVHDKNKNLYDGYALYSDDRIGEWHVREARMIAQGKEEKELDFQLLMQETRILHDPDWHGTRGQPELFLAQGAPEMASKLGRHLDLFLFLTTGNVDCDKVGEAFVTEDISQGTKVEVKQLSPEEAAEIMAGVKNGVMAKIPPDIKERLDEPIPIPLPQEKPKFQLTKAGKIPARTRSKLVAKYGEANIADMEARLAKKHNNES